MLLQFIQHNQPVEFIEIYKMQDKVLKDINNDTSTLVIEEEIKETHDKDEEESHSSLPNDVYFEDFGKSFLHLAVEHTSTEIIQFLLFKTHVDPNVLTHNT